MEESKKQIKSQGEALTLKDEKRQVTAPPEINLKGSHFQHLIREGRKSLQNASPINENQD